MSVSLRDRLKKNYNRVPYEQWRKNLRRSTIKSILFAVGAYLLSAIFTVWLLWGRSL